MPNPPRQAIDHDTMGYYTDVDLPFYYDLAQTFAISDRYFAAVIGQTFPNRAYFLAGTSFGHLTTSEIITAGGYKPITGTIFDRLDAAGVSWTDYFSDLPYSLMFATSAGTHEAGVDVRGRRGGRHACPPWRSSTPPRSLTQTINGAPLPDRRTSAERHPRRSVLRVDGHHRAAQQPELERLDSVPHVRRARRLLRPRGTTARPAGRRADPRRHRARAMRRRVEPSGERGTGWRRDLQRTARPSTRLGSVRRSRRPVPTRRTARRSTSSGSACPLVAVSPFAKPHYVSHTVGSHTSILALLENRFSLAEPHGAGCERQRPRGHVRLRQLAVR